MPSILYYWSTVMVLTVMPFCIIPWSWNANISLVPIRCCVRSIRIKFTGILNTRCIRNSRYNLINVDLKVCYLYAWSFTFSSYTSSLFLSSEFIQKKITKQYLYTLGVLLYIYYANFIRPFYRWLQGGSLDCNYMRALKVPLFENYFHLMRYST